MQWFPRGDHTGGVGVGGCKAGIAVLLLGSGSSDAMKQITPTWKMENLDSGPGLATRSLCGNFKASYFSGPYLPHLEIND